jgi:hypothetical protein
MVLIADLEKFSIGPFSFKVRIAPPYRDTEHDSLELHEEAMKKSGRNVVARKFVKVYGAPSGLQGVSYEDLDTGELFYVIDTCPDLAGLGGICGSK